MRCKIIINDEVNVKIEGLPVEIRRKIANKLKLDNENVSKDIEIASKQDEEKIEDNNQPLEKVKTETNNELKEKITDKRENKTISKNTSYLSFINPVS